MSSSYFSLPQQIRREACFGIRVLVSGGVLYRRCGGAGVRISSPSFCGAFESPPLLPDTPASSHTHTLHSCFAPVVLLVLNVQPFFFLRGGLNLQENTAEAEILEGKKTSGRKVKMSCERKGWGLSLRMMESKNASQICRLYFQSR